MWVGLYLFIHAFSCMHIRVFFCCMYIGTSKTRGAYRLDSYFNVCMQSGRNPFLWATEQAHDDVVQAMINAKVDRTMVEDVRK
jgi:hypothetical protein